HGVYYDEENRRHLNTIRMQYALAALNLSDNNRKEDAKKILERCDKMILQENFPYGMVSRGQQHNQIAMQFLMAAYRAGDSVLARKVSASLRKDLEQQLAYYHSLNESRMAALGRDNEIADYFLKQLQQFEQYNNPPPAKAVNPESTSTIINKPVIKDTQAKDNKR